MALFGGLMADPELKDFRNQIQALTKRLESRNLAEEIELTDEVVELKKQVTELEIERDKKQEDFDRQQRDIEHMIGLERKRSEQDAKNAVDEARLKVREENLDAEKSRLKEQMEFMEKRLQQELDSMRDMTNKVMEFIPKVEVDRRIREEVTRPAIESAKDGE